MPLLNDKFMRAKNVIRCSNNQIIILNNFHQSVSSHRIISLLLLDLILRSKIHSVVVSYHFTQTINTLCWSWIVRSSQIIFAMCCWCCCYKEQQLNCRPFSFQWTQWRQSIVLSLTWLEPIHRRIIVHSYNVVSFPEWSNVRNADQVATNPASIEKKIVFSFSWTRVESLAELFVNNWNHQRRMMTDKRYHVMICEIGTCSLLLTDIDDDMLWYSRVSDMWNLSMAWGNATNR